MSPRSKFRDYRPDEVVATFEGRQYQGRAFAKDRKQALGAIAILKHFGVPAILISRHAGVASGPEISGYLGDLYVIALALEMTAEEVRALVAFQRRATLVVESLGSWLEENLGRES